MQMGQTWDRTADLQVGGQPLYPSAIAAPLVVLYLQGLGTKEWREGFSAGLGGSPRETSPRRLLAPAGCISSVAVRRDRLWVGLERLGAGGTKSTPRKVSQKRLLFGGTKAGQSLPATAPAAEIRGSQAPKSESALQPTINIWNKENISPAAMIAS
ncbi:unnamed protein product [Pleuronectes platessa]|uniref:Uncharacterized protein n=1 Tax=Pleuronectes platessa TaxID=8262 RepID=A0A9N7VXM2_PLEPL|nr:unnamed protein product [Pleuronectes platessa]